MPFLDKRTLGKMAGGLLGARTEQAMGARQAAMLATKTTPSNVDRHVDVYRPRETDRWAATDTAARICGATGCTGSWVKPWKRRRPVFEDEWGCSSRCLYTMVQAAVRREVGEADTACDVPHRHRVPLGLVLLAQGWITHPQLQAALEAQRSSGQGRIGDWLVQSCGLSEDRVTRGLGLQWSCPVLSLERFEPARMALVMPQRFIREFGLIPLRVAGSSLLYMASANRMDAALALAVEQMTGLSVESGLLPGRDMQGAQERLLAATAVPETVMAMSDAENLSSQISRILERRQPVASQLVRLHGYYWLRVWLESGALSGVGRLPVSTEDVEDYLFTMRGSAA